MRFAWSAMCRCDGARWCVHIPAYAFLFMFMCECECHCDAHASRWHMAPRLPPPWPVLWVSLRAGREGRPSLWLTQAERGFLHVSCRAIWALVSMAAPLRPTWQHKVWLDICSFNLLVNRENNLVIKLSFYLSIYLHFMIKVSSISSNIVYLFEQID